MVSVNVWNGSSPASPAPVVTATETAMVAEIQRLNALLAKMPVAQVVQVQDVPVPSPSTPVPPSANRYADRIKQYEQRAAQLKMTQDNPAESDDRRGRAHADIEQFEDAIAMLNEAAAIPAGEKAWFVSDSGDFRVIIPPAIPGIYNRDRDRIESYNQYYHASDPMEIAVLRRAVRANTNRIFEKPEGTFPIMDWATRTFEGWGSWELFAARDAKRYRSV